MHFTDALDVLKKRKCYLRRGWLYTIVSDLDQIISAKFRANLSHSLAVIYRNPLN